MTSRIKNNPRWSSPGWRDALISKTIRWTAGWEALTFPPVNCLLMPAEGALGHGSHRYYGSWAMGDCGLPWLQIGTRTMRWESAGDRRFILITGPQQRLEGTLHRKVSSRIHQRDQSLPGITVEALEMSPHRLLTPKLRRLRVKAPGAGRVLPH